MWRPHIFKRLFCHRVIQVDDVHRNHLDDLPAIKSVGITGVDGQHYGFITFGQRNIEKGSLVVIAPSILWNCLGWAIFVLTRDDQTERTKIWRLVRW